jgi:transcriptional regulator with XRE-family HTH domain
MLTVAASRELGKGLRFLRHAQNLTLRDVAKRSGLSPQYIQNIERGERTNASDEAYEKLALGYEVPLVIIRGMLLKANIVSALERFGVDEANQAFIWRGVEQRLAEIGVDTKTDLARVVAEMLG